MAVRRSASARRSTRSGSGVPDVQVPAASSLSANVLVGPVVGVVIIVSGAAVRCVRLLSFGGSVSMVFIGQPSLFGHGPRVFAHRGAFRWRGIDGRRPPGPSQGRRTAIGAPT